MTQNLENKISVWGYILTLTKVKRGALAQIDRIRKTFEEYRQQNLLKIPIAANYYATYLIITLLILFSAIWLGLYLARGITVPIQQLAEATRHISEGNLDFEIGVQASTEGSTILSRSSESRRKTALTSPVARFMPAARMQRTD